MARVYRVKEKRKGEGFSQLLSKKTKKQKNDNVKEFLATNPLSHATRSPGSKKILQGDYIKTQGTSNFLM
jgi:hypothetical protein